MKNLDITFLFGIITTMTAAWYFLHAKIIKLTANERTHYSLWPMALVHYLIFVCIVSALIILYFQSVSYSVPSETLNTFYRLKWIAEQSQKILTIIWVPTMILFILLPVFVNLFRAANKTRLLVKFGNIAAFIIVALLMFCLCGEVFAILDSTIFKIILSLFVAFVLYLLVLTNLSASIKLKTDKEFYFGNEVCHLIITRQGYLALPYITSVRFNGIEVPYNENNDVASINLADSREMDRFTITIDPQVGTNFDKYHYLKIQRRP